MRDDKAYKILLRNFKTLFSLMDYSREYKVTYIIALILNSTTIIVFNFFIGKSIELITDSVFEGNWVKFKYSIIFAILATVVNSGLEFCGVYFMVSRVALLMGNIQKDIFRKLMRVTPSFYKEHHSGEIQGRLENDLNQTEQSLAFNLVEPLNQLTLGVGNIIFIALISPQMALISIALCMAVIGVFYFYVKPINESSTKIKDAIGESSAKFTDYVKGSSTIKMFNLHKWAGKRVDEENKKIMKWGLKLSTLNSKQMAINEINNYLSTFVILGIGALYLSAGTITPGGLLATSRYTASMVNAFLWFGSNVVYLQSILVGAKGVRNIIDEECEELQVKGSMDKSIYDVNEPVLEFEDVSFQYSKGDMVLSDFSAVIDKGERTALAGKSGAGKSTLMNLIMGFTPKGIKEGTIKLNGRDITEYSLKYLRNSITYVSQEPYLFEGSIKENIAMGKEGASMEEIKEAAVKANAHDFINDLPKKYDTEVGSDGAALSGGQVQRIAIARAMLKDAPIIFLDEPTSRLDSESEMEVQKALERLKSDKTVLIIAHRLSSIKDADSILFMENGQVIERGSHGELMELNNRYAQFYKM